MEFIFRVRLRVSVHRIKRRTRHIKWSNKGFEFERAYNDGSQRTETFNFKQRYIQMFYLGSAYRF